MCIHHKTNFAILDQKSAVPTLVVMQLSSCQSRCPVHSDKNKTVQENQIFDCSSNQHSESMQNDPTFSKVLLSST